ncbi:MAG: permease prefix domain 1-containing protein [Turicibacter sp.]
MNKISSYVENMFYCLPHTDEVIQVKETMMVNMEDKYTSLLAQGKTDSEAFLLVVSEFGSMEELCQEMNWNVNSTPTNPSPNLKMTEDYEAFRKKFSIGMAIGVGLCILACAVMVLLTEIFNVPESIGTTVFLCLIAIAVIDFVYFGIQSEKYESHQKKSPPKQQDSRAEALQGIIMISCTIVYLIIGFVYTAWHPGWIIFPIGGLLCAIINLGFTFTKK